LATPRVKKSAGRVRVYRGSDTGKMLVNSKVFKEMKVVKIGQMDLELFFDFDGVIQQRIDPSGKTLSIEIGFMKFENGDLSWV